MRGEFDIGRREFVAGVLGMTSITGALSTYVLTGAEEPAPAGDGLATLLDAAGGGRTSATPEASGATGGGRDATAAADGTVPGESNGGGVTALNGATATFGNAADSGSVLRLADLPRVGAPVLRPSEEPFTLDVRPGTVTLTADEATVARPLEFVLRLTDASGDERRYRTTCAPGTGGLEVTFDVGDVELPTVVGERASVTVAEADAPRADRRLAAVRRHVGVPYRLSDGTTGTRWVSADSLSAPVERTSGCVHEVLERDREYVVITAQRFRGKTFGASATIPKAHYRTRYDQRFRRKGDRKVSSVEYAARRDDEYLNRYARDLANAIERAGFTDLREKVLAAARTIQTYRYKWGHNARGGKTIQFPLQLLINNYGVCSGRTVLLAYLLATDHFGNITTAYGDLRMRGARHWAPGIDVRAFGYEPGQEPDEWYTFSPTEKQAFEYTEYVFLESIAVRDIGEFDPSIYTAPDLWDTVELKFHDSCC